MVKNKTKFGFSLAEALVSMLVLSLFFMATSKIISTRPKSEKITNKHEKKQTTTQPKNKNYFIPAGIAYKPSVYDTKVP